MVDVPASRHVTVVTAARPETVYALARDLSRLPEWAAGLATGKARVVDDTIVETDSPMGRVRAVFSPRNEFGVLDHRVTLPDGSVTDNPMRVMAHPAGSEIVFTVRPGSAPEKDFERDCRMVAEDLDRLAALAEGAGQNIT